ncbi:hypothetical protein DSO57_1032859 [Entomophthora muscae]|uniref:Uncharacterized protein n=1 Tax=Entomophthora muscae TaxID=34485 RepID=A0ACC2SD78_9FUNG|nr:hypothetical protein DSO57_1032859 [Entomophthora muscae]
MACWQDDNKVLSQKIASLEAKILESLSQEVNGNKIQGQDNDKFDWLDLDPSQDAVAPVWGGMLYHGQYRAAQMAYKVAIGLLSVALNLSEISAQHVHTAAIRDGSSREQLRSDPLSLLQTPALTRPWTCPFKPVPTIALLSTSRPSPKPSTGATFPVGVVWDPASQIQLPLCSWSSMPPNSQLAKSQMLVILVHTGLRLDGNPYPMEIYNPPVINI